jgi:hypothetical protein
MAVREHPAGTLWRLSQASWSGRLSLDLEHAATKVWLKDGHIVWAESSRQHRGLGHVLSDLLAIDEPALRVLARRWRDQQLSWADALLSDPSIGVDKVRNALLEHLREALLPLTTSPACRYRLEPGPASVLSHRSLSFLPEEVLCRPAGAGEPRESLLHLAERVYGARWIDVAVEGSLAGFGAGQAADRRLLEAAEALLLDHPHDNRLAVLRSGRGTFAGTRCQASGAVSTWLAFDPQLTLGGVFMGLRALLPSALAAGRAPILPSLSVSPSLFPGASDRVSYRSLLAQALSLGDGALAAHVFERDAISWASVSSDVREQSGLFDCLERANSALDLCANDLDQDRPSGASDAFVLLAGPQCFHVGGRVPGAERISLFLSFAPGASYGQSIAALSVGLSALSRHFGS